MKQLSFLLLFTICTYGQGSGLSGTLNLESRGFHNEGTSPAQDQLFYFGDLAASFQTHFADRYSLAARPRLKSWNTTRWLFDFEELAVSAAWEHADISIGSKKVFWGKAESFHLVDIINQTDLSKNLEYEDKLGQPMAEVKTYAEWGSINLYYLPVYRRPVLSGSEERFYYGFEPSPAGSFGRSFRNYHQSLSDFAIHFSPGFQAAGLGLGFFRGRSRIPEVTPIINPETWTLEGFSESYPQINRLSLEADYPLGSFILKSEALYQYKAGWGSDYRAMVGGVEYLHTNFLREGMDGNFFLEFQYNERGDDATEYANNDIFAAIMLMLNNAWNTEILGNVTFDVKNGSTVTQTALRHNLTGCVRLQLEYMGFWNIHPDDLTLYPLREDNYFSISSDFFF